jgi:hypothetical protein
MTKRKRDKGKKQYMYIKHHTDNKDWTTLTPLKWGWCQVLRKGKQFLLHYWHPCVTLVTNPMIRHKWGKDEQW